jgi:alkaline phosphatase
MMQPLNRRAWLKNGVLFLAAAGAKSSAHAAETKPLRIGLITDLHYADKPAAGTRHYRETLPKLAESAEKLSGLDFVVELGDFIDAADTVEAEQRYLSAIQQAFAVVAGPKHYVLGNHCVDTLTKAEFLAGVGQKDSFYSFDVADTHFVVLDACFRSDGAPYGRKNSQWNDANVPAAELEWLKADVTGTRKRIIVFAHQRLDNTRQHSVKNAAEVRQILEQAKVLAVFQGHSHQNDYQHIRGIHYCTLVAMVEGSGAENNGYSILEIDDTALRVTGFRRQKSYEWR